MLQTIRDRTQGWLAGIIVFVLILMFALWGISAYFTGGRADAVVAKVNGIEITKERFTLAYEQARRQLQVQLGLNSSLTTKQEAGLKNRVLHDLITTEVLKLASLAEHYHVSSLQIDNYLENIPEFQENGQFSMKKFQDVMAISSYSASELLDLIKTALLIAQPKLGIILTSFSLPNEINYTVSLVNQERDFHYLTLSMDSLADVQKPVISPEQIATYYKEHQNEFKTPEQVSIDYLELSLSNVMATIHPTVEVLKNYYNENISNFVTLNTMNKKETHQVQPFEQVKDKVREIIVRQQAEEKMAVLRDQLADLTYEHPETLLPAAKALSLPIKTTILFTREKGGQDVSSNKKIRDAAFTNDVVSLQNNSDLIQLNPETVIVLRVKAHLPPTLLPLVAVNKQIQDRLLLMQTQGQLSHVADEIYHSLQSGTSEEQIARQYKLSWVSLGFIGRYSNKVPTAILERAFQLQRPHVLGDKNSYGIAQLPNGYAIIALHTVHDGVLKDKKQYALFSEQVQNSEGMLEYELYKQSLLKKAKISISGNS